MHCPRLAACRSPARTCIDSLGLEVRRPAQDESSLACGVSFFFCTRRATARGICLRCRDRRDRKLTQDKCHAGKSILPTMVASQALVKIAEDRKHTVYLGDCLVMYMMLLSKAYLITRT